MPLNNNAPTPPPANPGHEPTDANTKGIAWTVLAFLVALFAVQATIYLYLSNRMHSRPALRPVMAREPVQSLENADRFPSEQQQQTEMQSYQWIDRERGIVRLPIERSMELIAQRGLPVRSFPDQDEKSALELRQEKAERK